LGYLRIYFYKKILDTFKIRDFEDFARFPYELKIPNPFIFRENEVFGNRNYAKFSLINY